jgi:radical SAM enzyme (TIGR01210 family)
VTRASVSYPKSPGERDAWIRQRRPDLNRKRDALPLDRPAGMLVEEEPDEGGNLLRSLTVFLTNRECPWRCLMCDLWQHTTRHPVPVGAIPRQLDSALSAVPGAFDQLKLYNAGSFFDAGAIPTADHPAIAARCRNVSRVVVECHPSLVGERILRFRDLLGTTRLEVALGLETVHPDTLAKLNKRMTTDDFARAAAFLRTHGLEVRVFLLVKPPFLDDSSALEWAARSVEFAFAHGANVVSLIPTRLGNGALEALVSSGEFTPPTLSLYEEAVDAALAQAQGRGRLFADLWDLERFSDGPDTFARRQARLEEMNRRQVVLSRIPSA